MAWFECGGGGSGGSSHNYSTTEQIVGTWVDGSPVYEKTVVAKNINYPTVGDGYVIGTILNSNEIIEITGTITNSTKTIKHALPYINDSSKVTTIRFNVSSGELLLRSFDTWSSLDVIVTIRYTKTST